MTTIMINENHVDPYWNVEVKAPCWNVEVETGADELIEVYQQYLDIKPMSHVMANLAQRGHGPRYDGVAEQIGELAPKIALIFDLAIIAESYDPRWTGLDPEKIEEIVDRLVWIASVFLQIGDYGLAALRSGRMSEYEQRKLLESTRDLAIMVEEALDEVNSIMCRD